MNFDPGIRDGFADEPCYSPRCSVRVWDISPSGKSGLQAKGFMSHNTLQISML